MQLENIPRVFSSILKVWWHAATLFIYFYINANGCQFEHISATIRSKLNKYFIPRSPPFRKDGLVEKAISHATVPLRYIYNTTST
jgi:hypothetical protein